MSTQSQNDVVLWRVNDSTEMWCCTVSSTLFIMALFPEVSQFGSWEFFPTFLLHSNSCITEIVWMICNCFVVAKRMRSSETGCRYLKKHFLANDEHYILGWLTLYIYIFQHYNDVRVILPECLVVCFYSCCIYVSVIFLHQNNFEQGKLIIFICDILFATQLDIELSFNPC